MYISSSGADWPESASVPLSGFAALVGSEVDVPAELETGVSVELLSPGASLAGRNNDQTQNAIITTPSIAMPAIFHLFFIISSFCQLRKYSESIFAVPTYDSMCQCGPVHMPDVPLAPTVSPAAYSVYGAAVTDAMC